VGDRERVGVNEKGREVREEEGVRQKRRDSGRSKEGWGIARVEDYREGV